MHSHIEPSLIAPLALCHPSLKPYQMFHSLEQLSPVRVQPGPDQMSLGSADERVRLVPLRAESGIELSRNYNDLFCS